MKWKDRAIFSSSIVLLVIYFIAVVIIAFMLWPEG